MGFVKVGVGVGTAQIAGVVAGKEEAYVALLVEGMRPGIGNSGLNVMRHLFFQVSLQRIVRGDAHRGEGSGVGIVADVGHAQIDVAAAIGVVWLVGHGIGRRLRIARTVVPAGRVGGAEHLQAVGVLLRHGRRRMF